MFVTELYIFQKDFNNIKGELTFHVDVEVVLMVIVVNLSNKFLCAILTAKVEFSEFVLLTKPFLLVPNALCASSGLHTWLVYKAVLAVPTCTRFTCTKCIMR